MIRALALALALTLAPVAAHPCTAARGAPRTVSAPLYAVTLRRRAPGATGRDGRARTDELLGRLSRQARALLATLDEIDAHLAGDGTMTADELEAFGRRLATIAASGLRVMEHDVAKGLEH